MLDTFLFIAIRRKYNMAKDFRQYFESLKKSLQAKAPLLEDHHKKLHGNKALFDFTSAGGSPIPKDHPNRQKAVDEVNRLHVSGHTDMSRRLWSKFIEPTNKDKSYFEKAAPSGQARRSAEFNELANRAAPLTEGQSPEMARINQLGHAVQMSGMKHKPDPLANKDIGNAITYHQGLDASGKPSLEGAATVSFNPGGEPTVPRQGGKFSQMGGAVRDKKLGEAKDIARRQSTAIKGQTSLPLHEEYFRSLRSKLHGQKK